MHPEIVILIKQEQQKQLNIFDSISLYKGDLCFDFICVPKERRVVFSRNEEGISCYVGILILPYEIKITTNYKISYFGFNIDRKSTYCQYDNNILYEILQKLIEQLFARFSNVQFCSYFGKTIYRTCISILLRGNT